MSNKIEMIGYNDTKAIAIYGNIKIMPALIISFVIAILSLIPTLILQVYELILIFIIPAILLVAMLMQYFLNSRYKTFLRDAKTEHKFCLDNGILYKDGNEIKSKHDIRLYKFKNFIFLELKQSYYRIMNDDYLTGSREKLLSQIRFHNRHYISINIPPKTDEEIINLLFNEVDLDGKERLFYSQDKRNIVYIYKNSAGSYSIGYERLFIAYDEERYFSGKYGWWEPDWGKHFISFYGTVDEAFIGIEIEIRDLIEMK